MNLKNIKSFLKKAEEITKSGYYINNKPISWLLVGMFILFSYFIGASLGIYFSIMVHLNNILFEILFFIILLPLGAIYGMFNCFWTESVLKIIDEHISLNKSFFLSSFWKSLFKIEEEFMKIKIIEKLFKIHNNYLKNSRLIWIIFNLFFTFINFYCLVYTIIPILTILKHLSPILIILISFAYIYLFVIFSTALSFLIIGQILLIIEKFRPTPEFNEVSHES